MSNTPLLNIIVLQDGYTPIDEARRLNNRKCVTILQRAMVCCSLHPHYQLIN